jgi:hypothetical protein
MPTGRAVEEDEVAGLEVARRDVRQVGVLHRRVVRERDAELGVDVHDEARAVEAVGARAAPHVRHAEVLLGDRDGLAAKGARRRRRDVSEVRSDSAGGGLGSTLRGVLALGDDRWIDAFRLLM